MKPEEAAKLLEDDLLPDGTPMETVARYSEAQDMGADALRKLDKMKRWIEEGIEICKEMKFQYPTMISYQRGYLTALQRIKKRLEKQNALDR